jgi:hypothetical protein
MTSFNFRAVVNTLFVNGTVSLAKIRIAVRSVFTSSSIMSQNVVTVVFMLTRGTTIYNLHSKNTSYSGYSINQFKINTLGLHLLLAPIKKYKKELLA